MNVLLHACCGPCSLMPVRILQEDGHEPVIFYANSNIAPAAEYVRRLDTLRGWAAEERVPVVEGCYDPATWEDAVGQMGDAVRAKFGLVADEHAAAFAHSHSEANTAHSPAVGKLSPEARAARRERCRACYRLRFEEAARYAADHGFDALGTTLSVSPYQYTDIIKEELERASSAAGVDCAFSDYRPFYNAATRKSRELGMYRQNFCGCRFSAEEAAAERAACAKARRLAHKAGEAARAAKRQQEQAVRAARKAEQAAYAAKQARKRAILKALREKREPCAQGGSACDIAASASYRTPESKQRNL